MEKNKIDDIVKQVLNKQLNQTQAVNQITALLNGQINESRFLDKSLPSSNDAERVILGAILLDNSLVYQVIDRLKESDFYSSLHRKVFKAITTITQRRTNFENSGFLDPILIGEELRRVGELDSIGGIAVITNLTFGLPHFSNIDEYIFVVLAKSKTRQLLKLCQITINDCLNENKDADEILTTHGDNLFKINIATQTEVRLSFEELVAAEMARFNSKDSKSTKGLSTGFKDWDTMTGGAYEGTLTIITARPSMGKSSLMRDVARGICAEDNNRVVVIFSLEESKEAVTKGLIVGQSGINYTLFKNKMLGTHDLIRLEDSLDALRGYKIVIDDTPNLSVAEMQTRLIQIRAEYGRLDAAMIDHANLVKTKETENRVVAVGDVSKDARIIGRIMKIPIFLLVQLSRKCEARTPPIPVMSDLYESGKLEQNADVIAAIYREEYYKPTDQNRGLADLIFLKNRDAPRDTICRLTWLGSSKTFRSRAM